MEDIIRIQNYLEKRLLRILLPISSSLPEFPRRDHPFFCFFLRWGGGEGDDKNQIKIWLLFSISLTFILEFFCDRCESLEIFSNCAVKQKLCRYKPCFILPSKHINRAMRAPALFRYFIKLHNFPLLDENCFY